jgi:hypothetical protein
MSDDPFDLTPRPRTVLDIVCTVCGESWADHPDVHGERICPTIVIHARHVEAMHNPVTDDRGYTCDERGCLICNVGWEGLASNMLAAGEWPDDEEIQEAREWMLQEGSTPDTVSPMSTSQNESN